MVGYSDLKGERALVSEMVLQAYEAYVDLRARGYILDGIPSIVPPEDNVPHAYDEAYTNVRFIFGPGLDLAVAMVGLRVDAYALRSKLEPELWEKLCEKHKLVAGKTKSPTALLPSGSTNAPESR